MNWLKIVLIAIGIVVLIGFGGLFLYEFAYSEGEAAGYIDGHGEGYTLGQEAGYDLGKTDGYNLGKQEGYDEGYLSGKADGYQEGVTAGYEEGVEAGVGHGYSIKDPTYKQALRFLEEDKTDQNSYVEDTYVCNHFARDICNNAETEGLRCAFVEIRYSEGGHSIIAFNTIDEGLVYFEPQHDDRVKPIVGERYYQCVEAHPGHYYEKPSFDDTIREILVIW